MRLLLIMKCNGALAKNGILLHALHQEKEKEMREKNP